MIDELDRQISNLNPIYGRGYDAGFQAGKEYMLQQVKKALDNIPDETHDPDVLELRRVLNVMLDEAYEEGHRNGNW